MPLTAPANEQEWQRLMGAPRDYTVDAQRGAEVAMMPFQTLQNQEKINNEAQANQGRLSLAQAEQQATAAYRQQSLRQQQAELGIRQQSEDRANQEWAHTQAVDKIMEPLRQSQAQLQLSSLQTEIAARQRTMDNITNDQKVIGAFTKRLDGLSDDAFVNGGAASLLGEYQDQLKSDDYFKRAQAMYDQRNNLINNKQQLAKRAQMLTDPDAVATYQQTLDATHDPNMAQAAGYAKYQTNLEAKGLRPSGTGNGPNQGRAVGANEIDLTPKEMRQQLIDMIGKNPDFYPKDPQGNPDYTDTSIRDSQVAAILGKLNQTIHSRGDANKGDPDTARDLLAGSLGNLRSWYLGKTDAQGNPINQPNQNGDKQQAPDFFNQYFGSKPGQTPAASTAPGEQYSGPPKPPTPQSTPLPRTPQAAGAAAQGTPAPQPEPQEIDQSSGGASNDQNPNSNAEQNLSLASGQPDSMLSNGLFRAMAYGPSQGEFTHDTMYGPLGALKQGDLALSPNLLSQFPLGSYVNVVDNNGKVLQENQRIADYSYLHPGQPTQNSFETWNGQDLGHAGLVAVAGPNQSNQD